MNPLTRWLSWLASRRNKRLAEQAERERRAIMQHRQYRREKRKAFVYLDGDLRRATNRAIAAEIGRPDLMRM